MSIASLLLFSTGLEAQPGSGQGPGARGRAGRGMMDEMGPHPGFGRFLLGPHLEHLAQKVGLAKNETKKIRDIVFRVQKEAIPLTAKISEAKLALHEKMDGDTAPSEAEISSLIDTIGKNGTQLKKNHALAMLQVRKIVGLEKWRKIEAMMVEFHGGAKGHRWGPK